MNVHVFVCTCDLQNESNRKPFFKITGIETALEYAQLRENFTLKNTSQHSAACQKIAERTLQNDWEKLKAEGKTINMLPARMLSGHLEGKICKISQF